MLLININIRLGGLLFWVYSATQHKSSPGVGERLFKVHLVLATLFPTFTQKMPSEQCDVGYIIDMRISTILRNKGSEVITVTPDTTIHQLLVILKQHDIGAVVVVDSDGELQGMASERDVVRHQVDNHEIHERPVSAIMTAVDHTCGPNDKLADLAITMTEYHVRHLPVVEKDRMIGVVSIGDIVKGRLQDLEAETQHLHSYISQ